MILRELVSFKLSKLIVAVTIPLIIAFFSTCHSTCNDATNICQSAYSDPICFSMVFVSVFLLVWIAYSLIAGFKKYYDNQKRS